ncbi:hypothetical protein GH865_04950 [Rhodocyclus tenuis]|uniref:hypothetical protein n=1 Tax=Rhodocyclus gracilis TaxID=2929842 RepID=UPI0012989AC0|nr:hypothetical protein [Rhodocyclus gracilis]MRD72597.1 hypothetical protein [Rhodocyclus gracilis]
MCYFTAVIPPPPPHETALPALYPQLRRLAENALVVLFVTIFMVLHCAPLRAADSDTPDSGACRVAMAADPAAPACRQGPQ